MQWVLEASAIRHKYTSFLVLQQSDQFLASHFRVFLGSLTNSGRMKTRIRAALIDLSGTLHIEDKLLPGALEGVKLLRENDIRVRFVTNTTKESRHSLLQRLHHLGFDIADDEIMTSLTAAKLKVETEKLRPLLFLERSALEEFDEVPTDDFDSVVVGLAPDCFNHESMSKAMNVLLDGGRLIAIHKAR